MQLRFAPVGRVAFHATLAALCRQFESGGGRKAAAGINHLPEADYERFVAAFAAAGWAGSA